MKFVAIGKIVKPQGIKGEVKVYLYAENPKFLEGVKLFFAIKQNKEFKAKTVSVRNGFAFILFEDVTSRNQAELLRNIELFIEKEKFNINEEGTFLIEDVLNLSIFNLENKKLGKLVDIEQYGSADIWIYESQTGTYSFPYIDKIVKLVDLKNKKIIVDENKLKEARVWKLMF